MQHADPLHLNLRIDGETAAVLDIDRKTVRTGAGGDLSFKGALAAFAGIPVPQSHPLAVIIPAETFALIEDGAEHRLEIGCGTWRTLRLVPGPEGLQIDDPLEDMSPVRFRSASILSLLDEDQAAFLVMNGVF